MNRYSVETRGQICGNGYIFSSFAKNVSENIGKKASKKLYIYI